MALVVEDGTGKVDADSYVSVADADTYHAARGHTDWVAATSDNRSIALRVATDYLDSAYEFKGVRSNDIQALEWPRAGASDGDGFTIASDAMPRRLINATAEAALLVVQGEELTPNLERGGQIYKQREKVGPLEEETTFTLSAPGSTVWVILNNLLGPLTGSSISNRKIVRS